MFLFFHFSVDGNNIEKMTQPYELYDMTFLVDRLITSLESVEHKKLTVQKPKVERKNRKTFVTNFSSFCKSVASEGRSCETIKIYVEKELLVDTSVMENGTLVINKSYMPGDIEQLFTKYIKTFVICQEPKCKSGDTYITKENKTTYIKCNTCKSSRAF